MSGGSTPIDQIPISSNEDQRMPETSGREISGRETSGRDVRIESRNAPLDHFSGQQGEGTMPMPPPHDPYYSGRGEGPSYYGRHQPDPYSMGYPSDPGMSYYSGGLGESMTTMIMHESKEPLIVAFVALLVQMAFLNGIVGKYVPGALNGDGETTITGMVVKGLIAGALFYVLKRFFR